MRFRAMVVVLGMTLLSACGGATTSGSGSATAGAVSGVGALPSPASCAPPAVSPAANPTPAPQGDGRPFVAATVSTGADSAPQSTAAGFGSLWAVAYRGEFVARIDPASGTVLTTIPLPRIGGTPVGSNRLVIGPHGMWLPIFESNATGAATQPNELLRLDPNTGKTALTVPIDSLYGVVDDSSGLWVGVDPQAGAVKRKAVMQLDPVTGRALRAIDLGPADASPTYRPEIDAGQGSLWVIIGDDRLARIDPARGAVSAVVRTTQAPGGFQAMAFDAGDVLLAQGDGSIARIDATTNCVTGVVYLGTTQQAADQSLLVTRDGLYVAYDAGALALIDVRSLTIVRAVRLDTQDFIGAPAVAGGALWYPTFSNNTLLRLKPLSAAG